MEVTGINVCNYEGINLIKSYKHNRTVMFNFKHLPMIDRRAKRFVIKKMCNKMFKKNRQWLNETEKKGNSEVTEIPTSKNREDFLESKKALI